MWPDVAIDLHPIVTEVQVLLRKIDGLRLPSSTRRDVESILVQQVTKEFDRVFPLQQGHGRRTALLAVGIGSIVGLDANSLHRLKLASLLHDIGLLMLPPHLLSQPRRWDSDAYLTMQCHPRIGAEWLETFCFLREASVLIAHHHERWDGTGYPYGLRGSFIPLGARILAIADAFDAIQVPRTKVRETRDRVAFRILRVAAGTQFDPELVEVCGQYLAQPESRVRDRFFGNDFQHSIHDEEDP